MTPDQTRRSLTIVAALAAFLFVFMYTNDRERLDPVEFSFYVPYAHDPCPASVTAFKDILLACDMSQEEQQGRADFVLEDKYAAGQAIFEVKNKQGDVVIAASKPRSSDDLEMLGAEAAFKLLLYRTHHPPQ